MTLIFVHRGVSYRAQIARFVVTTVRLSTLERMISANANVG